MIKKYRKKSVIIEAVQLLKTKESIDEGFMFIGKDGFYVTQNTEYGISIKRNDEGILAQYGDYIVKHSDGTFSAYNPLEFKLNYEPLKPDLNEIDYEIYNLGLVLSATIKRLVDLLE